MDIRIQEVSPACDEVKPLFKQLDQHNRSYCPPEICHLTQPDEMENIDSILLGVFCDDVLCGMGGLKFHSDYAEVTRMFIQEEFRGMGLAVKLLNKLEALALNRNLRQLKLETSDRFQFAVKLYSSYGFTFCEPFGVYIDKPYNTYMEFQIRA